MKLISFVVPCFNSAGYMKKCIETLLAGGEDVEIIIVDDGSDRDNTGEIADDFERMYPSIVKAVHQENGGHGEAVNTGLRYAAGKYFKVVDSDDWVDAKGYRKVMDTVREFEPSDEPDMIIADYVYDKTGVERKRIVRYGNVFPVEQMFTWEDVGKFKIDQYILMHSVIYKTQLLRSSNVKLPKHTFYVDNIFVFEPLPYVEKMYYIDVPFYRYFIGREDQSVNEKVMISRIDQQIYVTKRLIDAFLKLENERPRRRSYMRNYLRIMMEVSSIFLIISGTKENLLKKKELWKYVKGRDKVLYRQLRYSILGWSVNIPTRVGRFISKTGYKVVNSFIGFN